MTQVARFRAYRGVTDYYDKAGNCQQVADTANATINFVINNLSQYNSASGCSISNGSEHEINAFNGVGYAYVNDERLSSATSGSTGYTMVYDALGRCVTRSLTGGPTTYYVYDGEKPILDYDRTGTSVGTNVYGKGIDEIVKRVAIGFDNNSYTYYPQQNHEGSVNELTDTSGTVIERYRYDAFGAPTFYTGTWGPRSYTIYDNRFLFTGREYASTYRSTYINPAFNFYEYRARAYNPTLGRFMSEDPKLFDAGDYNLFRYCHNDPIDLTDPMGTANMPYHLTPELMNYLYGKAMAAAQWAGSDLLHASTAAGAIGVAAMGQTGVSVLSQAVRTGSQGTKLSKAQTAKQPEDNFSTGAYIQRTETGADLTIHTQAGTTYYQTNVNWALRVFDHGKPVPNLELQEHLTYRDGKDFIPAKEHGFHTGSDGRAPDVWRTPFTSRQGHVTSIQSFESRLGKTEGWTTHIDTLGYETDEFIQFFH